MAINCEYVAGTVEMTGRVESRAGNSRSPTFFLRRVIFESCNQLATSTCPCQLAGCIFSSGIPSATLHAGLTRIEVKFRFIWVKLDGV